MQKAWQKLVGIAVVSAGVVLVLATIASPAVLYGRASLFLHYLEASRYSQDLSFWERMVYSFILSSS